MACTMLDIKNRYPKEKMVPLLDDLNLSATEKELIKVQQMWETGFSIQEMAHYLRPEDKPENTVDEVWLMVMHLTRQGRIGKRPGGYAGFKDMKK